jgi:hypothetical protein
MTETGHGNKTVGAMMQTTRMANHMQPQQPAARGGGGWEMMVMMMGCNSKCALHFSLLFLICCLHLPSSLSPISPVPLSSTFRPFHTLNQQQR